MIRTVFSLLFLLVAAGFDCLACTSAIVSANVSLNGCPLLWKHRDSSKRDNFVDTVNCPDHRFDYIALFNAEDSLKHEAWAGVNRSGFAIMNTVAGNLKKNRPDWPDREGFIMTAALRCCITVEDFQNFLDSLPRPLGVQTNFGVIDASGGGAYFETDDLGYRRYNLDEAPSGVLIRSNFSCSSNCQGGYGYDRYENAESVIAPLAERCDISPELFTETLSREFFNSRTGNALTDKTTGKVRADGFIPRPSSVSSIVIELTENGPVMWTMLGFPPVAVTYPVTFENIPESLRRNTLTGRSIECDAALKRKSIIMDGKILDISKASDIISRQKALSAENYRLFRSRQQENSRK